MWIPLLVRLFYDTRLGPDHKRNRHTMSPNEFLDRSDRYGTGHAMDILTVYVFLLHTTMILSPSTYLTFHPEGETLGQTLAAILSSPAHDAFANARYPSFCVSQT